MPVSSSTSTAEHEDEVDSDAEGDGVVEEHNTSMTEHEDEVDSESEGDGVVDDEIGRRKLFDDKDGSYDSNSSIDLVELDGLKTPPKGKKIGNA